MALSHSQTPKSQPPNLILPHVDGDEGDVGAFRRSAQVGRDAVAFGPSDDGLEVADLDGGVQDGDLDVDLEMIRLDLGASE